jgi:hypothetical protein
MAFNNWTDDPVERDKDKVEADHINELRRNADQLEDRADSLEGRATALEALTTEHEQRLNEHIGVGGIENHPIATQAVPGFLGTDEKTWLDTYMPQNLATQEWVNEKFEYYVRPFSITIPASSYSGTIGWTQSDSESSWSYPIPYYTATFSLAALEAETGKDLKIFQVTNISASGYASGYFSGAMPLVSSWTSAANPYTQADINSITISGAFNCWGIPGHPYSTGGSVTISGTIVAVKKDAIIPK